MIKYKIYFFIFFFFFCFYSSQAESKKLVGVIPTCSYDTDLGFQYGAVANLIYFNNEISYDSLKHSLYLEVSRYTKGNQAFILTFESDELIKGVKTIIGVDFQRDYMSYFLGYNGANSFYNDSIVNNNKLFYRYDSQVFRAKMEFQKKISGTHFFLIAGLSSMHFHPRSVNLDKINKNYASQEWADEERLYEKYNTWGIISDKEKEPNWINYLKLGVKYDNRDNKINPKKGQVSEILLQTAPSFIFNEFPHTKLALVHRQYIPLFKDWTLAYRLFYQNHLGKHQIPFYSLPFLVNSQETGLAVQGLGGGKSLRGVRRNRILSQSFLMTNIEVRHYMFHFKIKPYSFQLGASAFLDAAYILREKDIKKYTTQIDEKEREKYFLNKKQVPHFTTGLGPKLIVNDVFVLSADVGYAFNKQDGEGFRTYINVGYSF